ncbi:hypothetical protein LRX75_21780 [Rhizobium sp. DKSPLA3]|uniref:Uncharacterized protein n=1 Tax=Rhizobium quercicola TaxID=2901226 RepID=A0A9X1NYJ1_9HYPH|nr:hypothetical protein [Rhizobium quercicola]MCD7111666.1 hypothetical protein [Rhizobium quercicola]
MIDTLRRYTDTSRIHTIDRERAQELYDDAMSRVGEDDDPNLSDAGRQRAAEQRRELAFAAEEFAYAFFIQHGTALDGAADPDSFDYDMVGPFAARPVLTGPELRGEIIKHLRMYYPYTLPLELR